MNFDLQWAYLPNSLLLELLLGVLTENLRGLASFPYLYYIKKRWKAAVSGCDIVLHVASPVPSGNVTDGIFLL